MQHDSIKKRILVTGSGGFLGKATVELLKKNNAYEIIETTSQHHDLLDIETCKKITKNIDTVIHLAGLVLSRAEQQNRPAEVFRINTQMCLNVAEAARINNVNRLIFISSVTAYPEKIPSPFLEENLWDGPVSHGSYSYGIAKRIIETISRTYMEQYNIETCTLFLPNLYGPNDKFNYSPPPLIPNLIQTIQRATENKVPSIEGGSNGNVELDLLYVTDAAQAVIKAINAESLPPLINISSEQTIKIKDVYTIIASAFCYTGNITWEESEQHSTPRIMDSNLAKKYLNWQSVTSFEEGIFQTISSITKK